MIRLAPIVFYVRPLPDQSVETSSYPISLKTCSSVTCTNCAYPQFGTLLNVVKNVKNFGTLRLLEALLKVSDALHHVATWEK